MALNNNVFQFYFIKMETNYGLRPSIRHQLYGSVSFRDSDSNCDIGTAFLTYKSRILPLIIFMFPTLELQMHLPLYKLFMVQ